LPLIKYFNENNHLRVNYTAGSGGISFPATMGPQYVTENTRKNH